MHQPPSSVSSTLFRLPDPDWWLADLWADLQIRDRCVKQDQKSVFLGGAFYAVDACKYPNSSLSWPKPESPLSCAIQPECTLWILQTHLPDVHSILCPGTLSVRGTRSVTFSFARFQMALLGIGKRTHFIVLHSCKLKSTTVLESENSAMQKPPSQACHQTNESS